MELRISITNVKNCVVSMGDIKPDCLIDALEVTRNYLVKMQGYAD